MHAVTGYSDTSNDSVDNLSATLGKRNEGRIRYSCYVDNDPY